MSLEQMEVSLTETQNEVLALKAQIEQLLAEKLEMKNKFEENCQAAIAQQLKTHFERNPPVGTSHQLPPNLNLTNNLSANNKFDYKEFFKTIPDFDGISYPVESFIQACKDAKEYLREINEDALVRILKSKCKGEPLIRVSGSNVKTIDEFIAFLNLNFRLSKQVSVWLKEFNDLEQKSSERVMDFYHRVNKHLQDTCSEIADTGGNSKDEKIVLAKETAVQAFISGLEPRLALFLHNDEFADLATAATAAIKAEQKLQQMKNINKLFKPFDNNSNKNCFAIQDPNPHNTINQNNHHIRNLNPYQQFNKNYNRNSREKSEQVNNQNRNNPNKFCNFCKRNNHNIEECRILIQRKNIESNQIINKNILQCDYCKMNGHSVNNCRKKIYNEGKRDGLNAKPSTGTGNDQAFPRVGAPMGNVAIQRQNLNKN